MTVSTSSLFEALAEAFAPAYQYGSLSREDDTFRLIKLQNTLIGITEVDLVAYPLSAAPPYIAISYTWGNPDQCHILVVGDAKLRVTASVYDIVQALKPSTNEPLYLWIDFVCINQLDLAEKDYQIPLMCAIYRGAEEVVCYLGTAPDADLAHDFVPVVSEYWGKLLVQDLAPKLAASKPTASPFDDKARVAALQRLLANKYWTRAWIIQEIISGRKVRLLYGHRYLDWDQFGSIIKFSWAEIDGNEQLLVALDKKTRGEALWSMNCIDNLHSVKQIMANSGPLPLQDVLLLACQSNATDPRDKVIALLALSRSASSPELQPDYKLSVDQVYIKATFHAVQNGNFGLMTLGGALNHLRSKTASKVGSLPSWVPDLSAPPPFWPLDNPQAQYSAGGPPPNVHVSLVHGDRMLSVRGIVIGRIAAVCPFPDATTAAAPIENYGEYLRKVADTVSYTRKEAETLYWPLETIITHFLNRYVPDPYPTTRAGQRPCTRLEALWRTMTGNEITTPYGLVYPAPDDCDQAFSLYRRVLRPLDYYRFFPSSSDPDPSQSQQLSDEENRDFLRISSAISRKSGFARRLAVTEQGHLALVQFGVDVGDLVCVFLGARTPFVVRDLLGDGRILSLLCESYVHGFMDGEGLGMGCEERDFEIL